MGTIIGHGGILRTLDRLVARGALAHAYLFVGPNGVGKTTIARWLARRVLCQKLAVSRQASGNTQQESTPYQEIPCGACAACDAVERGTHPDVFCIGATGVVSVDEVRSWNESLAQSSLLAGWKVGIMEGAEILGDAAANACLKAIEEPTPRTLLMLTATTPRAVLPTIASRCAIVRFSRVAAEEVCAALRARGVAADGVEQIVAAADGCPGHALAFAEDAAACARVAEERAALAEACDGPVADRLRQVDTLVRGLPPDRVAARTATTAWLRALVALATEHTRARAADCTVLLPWLHMLTRAPDLLAANVPPRLVFESIALAHP